MLANFADKKVDERKIAQCHQKGPMGRRQSLRGYDLLIS